MLLSWPPMASHGVTSVGCRLLGRTNRVDGAACAIMLALIQLSNTIGAPGAASWEGLKMATAPNDASHSSMTPVGRRADVPVFRNHCGGIEAVSAEENKDRFKGTGCRISREAAMLAEKPRWMERDRDVGCMRFAMFRSRFQVGVLVGGRFC